MVKRHSMDWKKSELEEVKRLANAHAVVAVASISGFPSGLFQRIRKKLHGKAIVKVTKLRVAKRAFAEIDSVKSLGDKMEGSVALIFTNLNPFELFGILKKNKGSLFAKEGQIAEEDIVIPEGDTGLPPGPALSELKGAGLKVKPMGATIHVMDDAVVAKKGQPVPKNVVGILQKLNIKPFKIGLNIVMALENGVIYSKDTLDIDVEKLANEFASGSASAMNLALNIAYISRQTMPILIVKGHQNAFNLALNAHILNKGTAGFILGKASRQAAALNGLVKWEAPASA